jgi:hypothetical protein
MTRPGCFMLGALIATAGFAGAPSAYAARHRLTAPAASPTCKLASSAKVKSALGFTVPAALVTKNGPVTVCQFESSTDLLVRFETSETAPLFAFGRKSFTQHGYPTTAVNGLGTKAYSSRAGAKTITLVVLQGKTELLITALAPLAKIEALARLILPSL